MKIDSRVGREIVEHIEKQLAKYKEDPAHPDLIVPYTFHDEDNNGFWVGRVRIERPSRTVTLGPVDDPYKETRTEIFGVDK